MKKRFSRLSCGFPATASANGNQLFSVSEPINLDIVDAKFGVGRALDLMSLAQIFKATKNSTVIENKKK